MNKIIDFEKFKLSELHIVSALLKFDIFSTEKEDEDDAIEAELDAILADIPKYQPKEIDGPVFQIIRCKCCEYNNIISPPPPSLDDLCCSECGKLLNGDMPG